MHRGFAMSSSPQCFPAMRRALRFSTTEQHTAGFYRTSNSRAPSLCIMAWHAGKRPIISMTSTMSSEIAGVAAWQTSTTVGKKAMTAGLTEPSELSRRSANVLSTLSVALSAAITTFC